MKAIFCVKYPHYYSSNGFIKMIDHRKLHSVHKLQINGSGIWHLTGTQLVLNVRFVELIAATHSIQVFTITQATDIKCVIPVDKLVHM